MKISQAGLDAIKRHEGLRLHAYYDSAGVPTVGFGHTVNVQINDHISEETAEAFLRSDLAWVEAAINNAIRVPVTQQQYDALCSLVFNIGGSAFQGSTLLRKLNDGDFAGAAEEFGRWDKATVNGIKTVLPGLTARRSAERAMFLATAPSPAPEKPATAPKTPSVDPSQYSQEAGMPLPAIAAALLPALFEVFTPFAREKLTKEMGRHSDKPEVAAQIANGVIESVRVATGITDPVAAVAKVRQDAELAKTVEADALQRLDQMLPLLERMNAMEQANIASARQYNAAEPLFIDTPWIKLRFVHILSLAFVSFSGWFATVNWAGLTPELRGAVITLMVIAGWNGVRDYWMGSSDSSAMKTAMLSRVK